MHAETLRGVGRAKLPFAEYSVVAVVAPRLQPGLTTLFEIAWDDQRRALRVACEWRRSTENPRQPSLPVVIGSGSHPFPFRTRKLSLIPPMVLYGKLYGRVGRCRHYFDKPGVRNHAGLFLCTRWMALCARHFQAPCKS